MDDEQKLNILVAYPYMEDKIKLINENKHLIRFVLDSGAFTAWKANKKIELDDYCKFIERLPFKPWKYFTLDVVGNPDATLKNYEIMLRRGFKPIPIFTRGEDIKAIDEYYKTSDIVGIGGLVGTPGNKGFVKGIMKIIGNRKVHWLGFVHLDFIKQYKPYMCDSSTWSAAPRYGRITFYVGGDEKVIITQKNVYDQNIKKILKDKNIDVMDSAKKDAWRLFGRKKSFLKSCTINGSLRLSLDIEKTFKTYMFLAIAIGDSYLVDFLDEYKRMKNII